MLQLRKTEPFAKGGNRLCYVHPDKPDCCVKVRRPDFPLEERRRKKGFPKNLRPLSSFDDNLEEFKVMTGLGRHYGNCVFRHISRCFGFADTDMGKGLVSELIRDGDGRVSQTLKKYIWDFGMTSVVEQKINELTDFWRELRIPSRDLLLHNIVVQCGEEGRILRLVVIDGLGSSGVLPLRVLPVFFQDRRITSKIVNMEKRIQRLLNERGERSFPGPHGLLLHDGLPESAEQKHTPLGTEQ